MSDGTVQYGIYAFGGGGALELRGSEVYSCGRGAAIYVHDLSATLLGDLLSSQGYGVHTAGSGLSVDMSNCNITGTTNWLNNGSGYTVTVGAPKLVGTTTGGGTTNCFGNYTGSAFLANTCP